MSETKPPKKERTSHRADALMDDGPPSKKIRSEGHSLVIVESPTKQKTIAKFLGNGYVIMATFGHIRDLPSRSLGVDETNGFEPQYVILPKAKKVIPGLKEAVKG